MRDSRDDVGTRCFAADLKKLASLRGAQSVPGGTAQDLGGPSAISSGAERRIGGR